MEDCSLNKEDYFPKNFPELGLQILFAILKIPKWVEELESIWIMGFLE